MEGRGVLPCLSINQLTKGDKDMETIPETEVVFEKFRKVLSGPDNDLFSKILDNFYDRLEEEYFSPEDLAEIEEAEAAIRWGDRSQFISLEEYERKHGL
jgi:hypothetical protein